MSSSHQTFQQRRDRVSAALAAVVFAMLLPALVSCGKKGDPLPPLSMVPLTTKDLRVRQQGRMILLDMTYPNVTLGGLSLGGIDAVELLELVKPAPPAPPDEAEAAPLPSADAREFEAAATPLLTLRGAELSAAVVGDRLQFRLPLADQLPAEPAASIFGVRTIKGSDVSAVSNRVTLIPIEPPPPPRNLRTVARAAGVELTWEAADDALAFDVFRRRAQVRGYGEPIRRIQGDSRKYLDKTARYDNRYIYTVRAVASKSPLIHSDQAGEREIDYEDRFAPRLPRNLVALAERASVRLRWESVPEEDVAGFIIYRREPGRNFHRITDTPVAGTEYLDRNLSSGLTYGYRIQVVDHRGNESALSDPVETTAR